jgi:hypothetical protein
MKSVLLTCIFLGLAAQTFAEDLFEESSVEEAAGRFLYFNTSSTATSLTLLGALILLGVIGYLIYAGGLLGGGSASGSYGYNRNDYYGQEQYGQYDGQYAQYRSNDNSPWEGINILQWIQVLQDMYQNFDYNDLDCQKRMICEVMKEPEYYGNVARKFKNGFQYAKYLELMNLPDEMRELLDEYLDANARSDQQKDCAEFFQCPFSIHDTMKRSEPTNSILN